jgi:SulP family sulfate permease
MNKNKAKRSPLPGLKSLLNYRRAWLRRDLLAGVTVAAYLIPQCMAYGELAGVQPIAGLWAILPPMLLYALLGSSPQLSVGPESTTAVMTAAAIAPLMVSDADYPAMAALLAIAVGGVCLVGYVARLGFLADLLSKPILIGYMAGVAVIMITGQIGKLSGIDVKAERPFSAIGEFLSKLDQIHPPTLMLGGLVLFFLFTVQRFLPKAPGPLLAVLLATVLVTLLELDQKGVAVVGNIPAGLPPIALPAVPPTTSVQSLLAAAVGIAIVGYSDNVLTARSFAARNHYSISPNQELLALAAANFGNGFVQGFPVSSSGSRTVIGDSLGSKTQLFSLVALGVVVVVLLFLRPVLALFPKAALGAIVIYAAIKLIEMSEFIKLYRFRKTELALALITLLGVLLTDILSGVAVAVSLSVIDLFARIARPHDAVLGTVPNVDGLHDIEDWEGATTIPGLVIYRYDAPLCFANVQNFKHRALEAIAAETEPVEWFVLNTEAIVQVDSTAIDALDAFRDELASQGITFAMTRVKQELYQQLKRSGLLYKIGADHVYPTLHTAIAGFKDR